MKKVLFLFLLFTVCAAVSARADSPNAAASIVLDATSGHVLDAANSDRKLQIGSLTKIATAMVVLDWAETGKHDLTELAGVPGFSEAVGRNNPMELRTGDRVSLRDLLYAALMQSDNIAALTLAAHVGAALSGNEKASATDRFIAQMNALARHLRMERTLFVNSHGLDADERKVPYSTASEVALLARYAMAKSAFRFFVSQKERRINIARANGAQDKYTLRNTNELLGVNGIDGVKTGTTRRAGECLVVSSERPPESVKEGDAFVITPRRLIVVVLGATSRFQVASAMVEHGWELHERWVAAGRPEKTRR